jgi:hypothetical protein
MATHGQLPGQVSVATSHGYVALQAGVGVRVPLAPPAKRSRPDPHGLLTPVGSHLLPVLGSASVEGWPGVAACCCGNV